MSSPDRPNPTPVFETLLESHQEGLVGYVRRKGSGLLRFESLEDLVQGVNQRALKSAPHFEYVDEISFKNWLLTLAERFIADRHDHWMAMRRGSGKVLRITFSGAESGAGLPPALQAGPSTVASRKELLVLAAKAMAALPTRDRKLVRWASEGVPLDVQAERLELSYAAVQKAGHRAFERFRKTFLLATKLSLP